ARLAAALFGTSNQSGWGWPARARTARSSSRPPPKLFPECATTATRTFFQGAPGRANAGRLLGGIRCNLERNRARTRADGRSPPRDPAKGVGRLVMQLPRHGLLEPPSIGSAAPVVTRRQAADEIVPISRSRGLTNAAVRSIDPRGIAPGARGAPSRTAGDGPKSALVVKLVFRSAPDPGPVSETPAGLQSVVDAAAGDAAVELFRAYGVTIAPLANPGDHKPMVDLAALGIVRFTAPA